MDVVRYRLMLELGPRLGGVVANFAKQNGCTKQDVLRRGLELLIAADSAKQEGFTHVGAWKDEPDKRTERVFILGF